MEFIFNSARMVTHTHIQSMEQTKEDPEHWFENLRSSDKAYAITQRVNNEMIWSWIYDNKKKGKEKKHGNDDTDEEGEGRG